MVGLRHCVLHVAVFRPLFLTQVTTINAKETMVFCHGREASEAWDIFLYKSFLFWELFEPNEVNAGLYTSSNELACLSCLFCSCSLLA
jgi:hypothetical protein